MGGERRISGSSADPLPFILMGSILTAATMLFGMVCFGLGILLTR